MIAVLGLALLDSLNPTLFAGELYVLRGAHPERRAFAFIAGVFVVMLVGGWLLAGGLTRWVATHFSRLPDEVWLHAQVALGLGLVVFGLFYRAPADGRRVRKPPSGLFGPFLFGVLLMLNEVMTAVPYFAAIALMSEASLSSSEWLIGLLVYNLVFVVPLLAFVAAHRVYRAHFDVLSDRIDGWMRQWGPRVLRYGSIAFGVLLLGDAAVTAAFG
ncbi:MAG: GAP family protein [Cyanobium sp.]